MNTPILARDLTKRAPHSPRERIAGFAIAGRTVDKCRAGLAGTLGEYHYDCPLDNKLFSFKGITGEQFKAAVQAAKTYEEVGSWLQANGTRRTPAEIKAWSDEMTHIYFRTGANMKTTEVRGRGHTTEPGEHKTSPAAATESPTSRELLALIAQQPFFKGLGAHHLRLLADSAMETQFEPGQWIYRQGDPANRFYLILEGKVVIQSEMKKRGMIPIGGRKPQRHAAFDGTHRHKSPVKINDCGEGHDPNQTYL